MPFSTPLRKKQHSQVRIATKFTRFKSRTPIPESKQSTLQRELKMMTMGERKIKEPAHSALNCTAKGEPEENQRKSWDCKHS